MLILMLGNNIQKNSKRNLYLKIVILYRYRAASIINPSFNLLCKNIQAQNQAHASSENKSI